MKYVIYGGGGYIGCELSMMLLSHGNHVRVFDRFKTDRVLIDRCSQNINFEYMVGNVLDAAQLKKSCIDADVIIWLAAIVSPKKCDEASYDLVYRTNVEALKIINEIRKNVPIVFVSTNIGYGGEESKYVYTEKSVLNPVSLYGKTKKIGENLLINSSDYIILRPASVFGVSLRMKDHLLIHYYCEQAVRHGIVELTEPTLMRNFINITDFCKGIEFLIDKYATVKNNIYNLGDSRLDCTKVELLASIYQIYPKFDTVTSDAYHDQDKRNYVVSNKKIEEIGFSCQADFRSEILKIIDYYKTLSI